MKLRYITSLLLIGCLLLSGCSGGDATDNPTQSDASASESGLSEIDFSQTDDDMFTKRDADTDYDENSAVHIELLGSSASCNDSSVQISGSTITITQAGTYLVTGTLENGMIQIRASKSDKIQLIFDNVTITSETNAPLYVSQADKVFITLAAGSENTLSNGGSFTSIDENNIDGAVFSKDDLTFNGSGTLSIRSPGGHGIVAKDDLVFYGGNYSITSSGHGIDANDSLRIKDANLNISAGKDGAHIENEDNTDLGFIYISGGNLQIQAEGDGLSASSYIHILEGDFDLLCGGGYENAQKTASDNWGNFGGMHEMPDGNRPDGNMPDGNMSGGNRPGGDMPNGGNRPNADMSDGNTMSEVKDSLETASDDGSTSMKGLKADNSILLENGTFTINSADDSIHSNYAIYIKDGSYTLSSGDDAIHADEQLEISSGEITVCTSYEGLEALHIHILGGNISITADDDGINAAGGTDASGSNGGRDAMFSGERPDMNENSNGSILISGGNIFIYAEGDGLDANGYIELTGGQIITTGPTQGDTSILDYDTTASIENTTFIGVGSSSMVQTFSEGSQGTLAVQVSASANTPILILDADGTQIVSFTPQTAFQCIIISTPDIITGESYTICVGDAEGSFTAR